MSFVNIQVIKKMNPIETKGIWLQNQLVTNVSDISDSYPGENITSFYSDGKEYLFNGTILNLKTALNL